MQYAILGNSLQEISRLGIGALHFGVFLDQNATSRVISQALDQGINFVDTAPMYGEGRSETFIKVALNNRRKQVVIATKVGLKPCRTREGHFGVETVPLSRNNIRGSVEASLSALGTDYIDLLQLHCFDQPRLEETFETLEALVKEGKVRAVGCSNYDGSALEYACDFLDNREGLQFVSAQAHYNLIERRAEKEIAPVCVRRDIGIIVNRSLARGLLSGQYNADGSIPPGSRAASSMRVRRWLEPSTLRLVEDLQVLADRYQWTLPQLALTWLLARPQVSVALVGIRNDRQLADCLGVVNHKLSAIQLAEIDKVIEEHGLIEQVYGRPPELFEK